MGEGGGEAEARMMQMAADLDPVSMTWKGAATEHTNYDLVLLQ